MTTTQLPRRFLPRREGLILLALLTASIAAIIFISLDDLIGAVGLRRLYFGFGFAVAGVYLFVWLLWQFWYKALSLWAALLIGGIFFFCAFVNDMRSFDVLRWFLARATYWLPPLAIVVVLCILFLWTWNHLRSLLPRAGYIRYIIMILPVFMAIYLLGISSRPGRVEFDSLGDIQFKGSHYYLYLRWGHSGDPDGLTLYECNSLALLCEDVHFSHDYYWGDAVELVTDDTTKTVQIVVNGNVLYTHATVAHGE